ncbi:hypothetical protein [Nesterenkonia sp. PF2B19]|uniref:hypothetical protein n=1 Tax=Nesterenkonia sp. PF2B19 TaxID=1881858 RepID=UPI00111C3F3F|nr:hypothetical protein [Nesterenkonia sp. PF2B19]
MSTTGHVITALAAILSMGRYLWERATVWYLDMTEPDLWYFWLFLPDLVIFALVVLALVMNRERIALRIVIGALSAVAVGLAAFGYFSGTNSIGGGFALMLSWPAHFIVGVLLIVTMFATHISSSQTDTSAAMVHVIYRKHRRTLDEAVILATADEQIARDLVRGHERDPEYVVEWESLPVPDASQQELADGVSIHLLSSGGPSDTQAEDISAIGRSAFISRDRAERALTDAAGDDSLVDPRLRTLVLGRELPHPV